VLFAVLANIHGNLSALQAVLADIDMRGERLDRIVSTGDLVGRGPRPNEVLDLLREREIDAVIGNYDDAVAYQRIGSGVDFPDQATESADQMAVEWTRGQLTPANLAYLQKLPKDMRIFRAASGVKVQRNAQDERASEYRRTYFARALFGGLYRSPPNPAKRILVVHGSPRALNEYVRADTATSILTTIGVEAQADILITGHAGTGFRRKSGAVTFVGAGSLSGSQVAPGEAEYALVRIGSDIEVEFPRVAYDPSDYLSGLERHGLSSAFIEPFNGAIGL